MHIEGLNGSAPGALGRLEDKKQVLEFLQLRQPLIDTLGVTRHSTRSKAALVLSWIGGKEAKQAIERAIEKEDDNQTREQFKEALIEFHKRWGRWN